MIALELFSCSGGMAEGFRRAGITFEWVFDQDPNACESYNANLRHLPICMDVNELARLVAGGWRPDVVVPIDLVVADPPCTPWSRAGSRKGTEDERDMFPVTIDLIRLLRPVAYLIGNVPGLDDADNWTATVQPQLERLREVGYCTLDYASLDAADFGVPQHRVRPFWFGHLAHSPCLRWPLPTHGDGSTLRLDGCKPWVTCRDALGHLDASELGKAVRVGKSAADARNYSRASGHPVVRPDEPSRAVTVAGNGKAGAVLAWPWDRPSTTVVGDARLSKPGHHDPKAAGSSRQHGPNAIKLSERAAAILQGFPDGWVFAGKSKAARWSQIGQAMPPGLAEPVARAILAWFAEGGR